MNTGGEMMMITKDRIDWPTIPLHIFYAQAEAAVQLEEKFTVNTIHHKTKKETNESHETEQHSIEINFMDGKESKEKMEMLRFIWFYLDRM